MENKALRRIEKGVQRLLEEHGRVLVRQEQLAAALAKGREEIERLKAANFEYKNDRATVRKRLDAVIKKIDALGPDEVSEES